MSIQGDPVGTWPVFRGGRGPQISSIYDVAPSFLGDLGAYFEQNPFKVPIDQVTGFAQITPYSADLGLESGTTTSQTYADLAAPATVGPQITSLPDGKYAVLWGAGARTSNSGVRAIMGMALNGTVDDTKEAYTLSTAQSGIVFGTVFTLSAGGSNSLVAKYRVNGASVTGLFACRWILAIRITGP